MELINKIDLFYAISHEDTVVLRNGQHATIKFINKNPEYDKQSLVGLIYGNKGARVHTWFKNGSHRGDYESPYDIIKTLVHGD